KLRMFVPAANGYELRLPANCKGEVNSGASRVSLNDLIAQDLLPQKEGFPTMMLTVGKTGFVQISDVRIEFGFDNTPIVVAPPPPPPPPPPRPSAAPAPVAPKIVMPTAQPKRERMSSAVALDFEAFSPAKVFMNGLREDGLFRGLLTGLLIFHFGLVQWASGIKFTLPPPEVNVQKTIARVSKFIPKAAVKPPEAKIGRVETKVASGDSKKEDSDKQEQNSTKDKEGEKKGYGEKTNDPGQGVDLSNVGVLKLLGGSGVSDNSSSLIESLVQKDLAEGLDQNGKKTKLSAGRSKTGGGSDLDAILAAGILGEGKGGGGAGIDEILKGDIGAQKSVNLEKKGRVNIEKLGEVSGSQEALGARGEESLRKVLNENMGRLKYIFEKYLKANPDIGGIVNVEVSINADGTVSKVVIMKSDIPLPDFQQEIIEAIRRWKYPPIASGIMRVVYPIGFVRMN
ncbi:MAG: AgmX/PglI C-terminal domain-containing protein, partial [candidate division KSB1 bacterium]